MLPVHIAERTDLTPVAKLVYAAIKDQMRDNYVAWPSVRTICHKIGVTDKPVCRAISELESDGTIAVERRRRGQCNRYRLNEKCRSTSDTAAGGSPTHSSSESTGVTPIGVGDTPTEAPEKLRRNIQTKYNTNKRANPSESQAEEIYLAYPRKRAKKAGLKAITSALKRIPFEELLAATKRYAASVAEKEQKFIPFPASWFNGERWTDFDDDPVSDFQQAVQEVRSGQ